MLDGRAARTKASFDTLSKLKKIVDLFKAAKAKHDIQGFINHQNQTVIKPERKDLWKTLLGYGQFADACQECMQKRDRMLVNFWNHLVLKVGTVAQEDEDTGKEPYSRYLKRYTSAF